MTYEIDYENDGYVRIKDAETLNRYRALKYDAQPPKGNYFWAFDKETLFAKAAQMKREGKISDVKEIVGGGAGLFGTRQALRDLDMWYIRQGAQIAEECNPVEVYLFEYNNHESFIAWEGDLEAIKIIIDIWGYETAMTIKRLSPNSSIENIINTYYLKKRS